jgi:hypothetical protein
MLSSRRRLILKKGGEGSSSSHWPMPFLMNTLCQSAKKMRV